MTLRLRRGTDLERQSITFQEGELVYITDTKDLYAGDGTTVGGIKVSNIGSPSSLTQNLNLNGYSIQGSGTISATSFIGDGSALTGIDIGVQTGQEYDIDIRGRVRSFDSTVIIDPITNTLYGNFFGDGSNLTNVPGTIVPSGDYTINISGYVKSFADEIMIDPSTKNIYGNFYGDGSNLTNIPSIIPGNDYTINIAGYVKTFNDEVIVDPSTKTLYGDFIGSHQGSLRADDSTLLVDADTGSFFGLFVGDGSLLNGISLSQLDDLSLSSVQEGDLLSYNGTTWSNGTIDGATYRINILGADSSTLVDTVDNSIYGTFKGIVNASEDSRITSDSLFTPTLTLNSVVSNSNGQKLLFRGYGGTFDSPTEPGDFHRQGIIFNYYDGVDYRDNSLIFSYYRTSGAGYLAMSVADTAGTFFNTAIELDGDTQTVLVTGSVSSTGNASFDGTVTAASFKGSIVADDSTTIVDAINGTVSAPGYIQFGSYTTVERDLLIAANGMVIYNSTANRFQGYQNNAWINLDDGTAA